MFKDSFPSAKPKQSLINDEFERQEKRLAEKQDIIRQSISRMQGQMKKNLIMNGINYHLIEEKERHINELEQRIKSLTSSNSKERCTPTKREIEEAIFRNNREAYLVGSMDPNLCTKKLIEADELSEEHEKRINVMQAKIKELRSTNRALKLELEKRIQNV